MDLGWNYTTIDLLRRRILKQIRRPIDLSTVSFSTPKRRRVGSNYVSVDVIPNEGSSFPRGKRVEYLRVDIAELIPKTINIPYRGQVNVGELLSDINSKCGLKLQDSDIKRKRIKNAELPQTLDIEIKENNFFFTGKFKVRLVPNDFVSSEPNQVIDFNYDLRPIRNYLINLVPGQKIDALFLRQISSINPECCWELNDTPCEHNLKDSTVYSNSIESLDNRERRVLMIELCSDYCTSGSSKVRFIYD